MSDSGLDPSSAEMSARAPRDGGSGRVHLSEIGPDDEDVSFFQQPWWLDAMSEGRYRTVSAGDGVNTFLWLPFFETRRFGLRVLEMPPLTHTLGPVIRTPQGKAASVMATRRKLIETALEQLEAHDGFLQVLDPTLDDALDYALSGMEVSLRYTHRIDTAAGPDAIWADLRQKARLKVRRASKRFSVDQDEDVGGFFAFYDRNLRRRGLVNDHSQAVQARAARALAGRGRHCVLWARERLGGRPAAALLLVWDRRALYYFRATRSADLDAFDAPSLLVWNAILKACALGLAFDADGHLGRGGAVFMEDFGARRRQRLVVSRRSLPLKALEALQRRLPAWPRPPSARREALAARQHADAPPAGRLLLGESASEP